MEIAGLIVGVISLAEILFSKTFDFFKDLKSQPTALKNWVGK